MHTNSTLIAAGVLRRHPYQDPGRRTRYEYRLTTAGMDLYPVLVGLLRWGDRYLDQPTGGPSLELTHRDCGEPVDLVVRCRAGHDLGSLREVWPVPGPGARLLDPDDPRALPPTDPRLTLAAAPSR